MLKQSELNQINIPRYDELSVKRIYSMVIKKLPEIEPYFPTYEKGVYPTNRFFWTILSSLKKEMVDQLLKEAYEK